MNGITLALTRFWENGQLVEQKLDETKFPVVEEYMEVIGE